MSPMSWSSHKAKRSVSASLAGFVFIMSEGLGRMRADAWVTCVCEPSLHRRKSASLPVAPTVTVMTADSNLQIDPSTVCVVDAKSAFDHLVRESTGRSLQTDSAGVLRDQEEHANAEGEMQMGTSRADGRRCLDEEAREQCNDLGTLARRGSLNCESRIKSWRTAKRTVSNTNVIFDHIGRWSKCNLQNGIDEKWWVALTRSNRMRSPGVNFERSFLQGRGPMFVILFGACRVSSSATPF